MEPLPVDIRKLAQSETLLYFLQDFDGRETPLVTTVLWSQEEQLFTLEEPENFRSNGGRLIDYHLMGFEPSLSQWQRKYKLSDYDTSFIKKLVSQKIRSEEDILVPRQEIESLSTFQPSDVESIEELLGFMNISLQ